MALRPEDRLQVACKRYLDAALPVPGFYSGIEHARKQSLYSGQIQKAKGIKRGLADLNVWYLGKYIGLELKAGKNTTSDSQDAFAEAMRANGFDYHVCRSVRAVDNALRASGVPVPRSMAILAEQSDVKLASPVVAKPKRAIKPRTARPTQAALKRVAALRAKGIFQ